MKQLVYLFIAAVTVTAALCWWLVRLSNAPGKVRESAAAADSEWVD